MDMQPVKSSLIAKVGYDGPTKTLAVEFAKGDVYHYTDVTPKQFADLQGAKSIGAHFGEHIRAKHKFTKQSKKGSR